MSALPTINPERTGKLQSIGERQLGRQRLHYWRCVDCDSEYPGGVPSCNRHSIGLCPWCRPDSRPWSNGRGL